MDNKSNLGHENSLNDTACSLTIEEINENDERERIEELTLYQSEEDPARPSLEVPLHLFANSSSESKAEDNLIYDTAHSLIDASNQDVDIVCTQAEENCNQEDKDMDETGMSHLMESIPDSGPHIITIIHDSSNDLNELQVEDNVSKDMLKRFVINAEGIHPSIRPIDQSDSPTVELFSEKDDKNLEMESENKLVEHDFELEKQQVVIFSGDNTNIDDNNITMKSANDNQPMTITLIDDTSEMSETEGSCSKRTRLTSENENFICHQDRSSLDLSYELVAEVQSLDGQILKREVMTQTSSEPKKLKRKHKGSHDENFPTIRVEISGKESWKKYKCSSCSLKFVTEDLRDMHVRCHQHSLRNYKCLFCEYTDSQWLKMYNHLFQHGIEKPFKCTKCAFSCINKSDLNAHMAVHSNLKAFSCVKCKRTFKHRRNMIAHQRTCSGLDESGKPQRIESEEKYICELCKRQLSTKKNLDKHMEIHLDVKPFVCDQCGHSTRLKESLIMHKRIHTGEKPYKCDHELCDYATPDRSSLRRHKRTHTDDKPYSCQYCNYRSIQKHCLDTHMRRKHTGEQFVCGLCHYATHDRYGLNQHFKRHQNPDGTLTHEIEIQDENDKEKTESLTNTISADSPKRPAATYITLPSGAVLKSTVIGKDTVIEESSNKEMQESEDNKSVLIQVSQQGSIKQNNKKSVTSDNLSDSKEEVAMVQLGGLEADLLQQIHQPGDAVFIQDTGEIVIRRQDGHLLVIQQQEVELPTESNVTNENTESQPSKSLDLSVIPKVKTNITIDGNQKDESLSEDKSFESNNAG
uniref:zinc finger protein 37 homolog n=1 Tax=Styela clava TaxID=7725 RepID=UPI0019394EE1|nr:zinc finger protein 37 homolog [Styela clava]